MAWRPQLALFWLISAACGVDPVAGEDAGPDLPDAGTTADAAPPQMTVPTRYPADLVRSPITPSVAARAREIAARGPAQQDDVFLKAGASGSETSAFLNCFAGTQIDLDGRTALEPGIAHFKAGRIGTTTPFERYSLAVVIGRTAKWATTGDPSPLDQELAASTPRFAIVDFGTNDMGGANTYPAAVDVFYGHMSNLLDRLESLGVVPIVTGLWPRADDAEAARWVPTFDAATRALAEARQVPYISLYNGTVTLPGMGLVGDGVHGNSFRVSGSARPCVFTAAALQFHYNVRNLATMEMLDAMRRVVVEHEAAPDPPHLDPVNGAGTEASPFVIDELGFTHASDTTPGERKRASYPGCDAGQDESGPERVYRLSLAAPTAVRILVLDRGDVDVDVHLLRDGACVERNDRVIDRTLPAGEHLIVVDSYVGAAGERKGAYSLVVVRCESGDPDCS